jgi:hypothetical protein
MNRKNKQPIVASIKTRPTQPRDLADRFRELQRLRKEVDDLEKKLAQYGARKHKSNPTGKRSN